MADMIAALADAVLWPLIGLVGAIVLALVGWWAGERSGKQKAKTAAAKRNVKAGQDAKDNRNEMESQDDQRLVDILTGRMRDR
jgi:hypothetical protein